MLSSVFSCSGHLRGRWLLNQHPSALCSSFSFIPGAAAAEGAIFLSDLSYLVISISCFPAGLQHEGIFRVSGSQVEVNDIKNAFERGKEEPLKYPSNYCQALNFM